MIIEIDTIHIVHVLEFAVNNQTMGLVGITSNNTLTTIAFLCTFTDHYRVTDLSKSTASGAGAVSSTCWWCIDNRPCQMLG